MVDNLGSEDMQSIFPFNCSIGSYLKMDFRSKKDTY